MMLIIDYTSSALIRAGVTPLLLRNIILKSNCISLSASFTILINFPAASGRGIKLFLVLKRGEPRGINPQGIKFIIFY